MSFDAFELSEKCKFRLQLSSSLNDAVIKAAQKRCEGVTGRGRGNCMTAAFRALQAERVDEICKGDPEALVPVQYGFNARTSFSMPADGGYGTGIESSLLTNVQAAASTLQRDEEAAQGTSMETWRTRLLIGGGVLLLLALVKPAVVKSS